MIRKKREIPLRLQMLGALLRRIPSSHEKWGKINRDFKKGQAGLKGELELDYQVGFLQHDNFHFFQNLRIPIDDHIFQMDTLLLTPQFAMIIESKSIYGSLYFDPISKQVIRTFDGIKEGFPNPLQQAKRQEMLLKQWMTKHLLKTCPTHFLIAIGHPSTIVETSPDNYHIFQKILHAEHIIDKILELVEKNPEKYLTAYQLRKIGQLLIEQHTPQTFQALTHFSIHPHELLQGVPCPICKPLRMMQRIHGRWRCTKCRFISEDVHRGVVLDHLLLCGPLSNSQFQKVLQIDSPHTVKRLLQAMDLPTKGSKKGLVYLHPQEK